MGIIPNFLIQDKQWNLCKKLQSAIRDCFHEGEVACVKQLSDNGRHEEMSCRHGHVNYGFNAKLSFLHGAQVSAKDPPINRELADILALAEYQEEGETKWRRICLIQNKMNKGGSIAIDEDQLTLLSIFPSFFAKSKRLELHSDYLLRNMSGMLGSYGFISNDGEMTIVSARLLKLMLGSKHSFTLDMLAPVIVADQTSRHTIKTESYSSSPWGLLPFVDPNHCRMCKDVYDEFYHIFPPFRYLGRHRKDFHRHLSYPHGAAHSPGESVMSCLGMTEFVRDWTELRLGELIFEDDDSEYNTEIRRLILAIQQNEVTPSGRSLLVTSSTTNVTRRQEE